MMGAVSDELVGGKKKKSVREWMDENIKAELRPLTEEEKRRKLLEGRGVTLIGGARS